MPFEFVIYISRKMQIFRFQQLKSSLNKLLKFHRVLAK